MKKFALLILAFVAMTAHAQVDLSAIFDWNNPTQLNPSITPSTVNGGSVNVMGKTFTKDLIQISFQYPQGVGGGAYIETQVNAYTGETKYALIVTKGGQMVVTATGGATLNSITWDEYSDRYDLVVEPGQPGTIESRSWQAGTSGVSSVIFSNRGERSNFYTLTISYTAPSDILTATPSIANGSTVTSFKTLSLYFNSNMSIQDASGIRFSGNGYNKTMATTVSGSTVTLSLDEAVTADGDYTVTVPARSFRNTSGYYNAAMTFNIKVYQTRTTFNPVGITPEEGEYKELPQTISLKFDNDALIEDAGPFVMKKDGTAKYTVSLSKDDNDPTVILVKNSHGAITDNGVWTIDIPEKAIHNPFLGIEAEDRWNAARTITYTVNADAKPEDSETMKLAKELLGKSGVGYPAANSTSRIELQALVDATETPSDEALAAAIEAFYAETAVQLPETGKWYTVASVNSTGNRLYLRYADGAVTLTSDASGAAPFKATTTGEQTVLETADGKFLHVLTASDSYVGTSAKNITETQTYINNLTFSKLSVEGVAGKDLLGMMKMYGALGTESSSGNSASAYALVNQSNGSIATNATNNTLYFASGLTSAFEFTETTNDKVTPTVTLSDATIVRQPSTLTLTVDNVGKVALKDASKAYLAQNGEKVADVALTAVEGSDNSFTFTVEGLTDGIYDLMLPSGTFDYSQSGKTVNDTDLRVSFEVKDGGSTTENFNYNYGIYSYMIGGEISARTVKSEAVNDFIIFSQVGSPFTGMIPDETKTVRVSTYYSNQTIATGHLEVYPELTQVGYQEVQAMKLVLDQPVKKSDFGVNVQYCYVIEKGTYGDNNFAKWLADHNSIDPSQCHVNPIRVIIFYVDDNASGIQEVNVNDSEKEVIFDLSGRRLTQVTQPGIYIVNGKKRVIK